MSFQELLNKLICDDNDNDNDDNDKYCLISYEPLENKHITLDCNHKFNYKNIFFGMNILTLNMERPSESRATLTTTVPPALRTAFLFAFQTACTTLLYSCLNSSNGQNGNIYIALI